MEVKELKENERGTFKCMLREVKELESRNGDAFCVLKLRTMQEEFEAKMWKTTREDVLRITPEMTAVEAVVKRSDYQGTVGYVANSVIPDPDRDPGDIADYADRSKIPGQEMYDYIVKTVSTHCPDEQIVGIFRDLYTRNMAKLVYWPAAMTVHHNYHGGLMMHSGTVLSDCLKSVRVIRDLGVVSKLTFKDARDKLCEILGGFEGSFPAGVAGRFYAQCDENGKTEEQTVRMRRILFNLMLSLKLAANYPLINRGLLAGAAALKGCSVVSGEFLAPYIGIPAADIRLLQRMVPVEMRGEEHLLLEHCLIVDSENSRGALIPESYMCSLTDEVAAYMFGHMREAAVADSGMLLAAAALHDIGKIHELDSNPLGIADYHVCGNLFGHTGLGLQMISEAAARNGVPEAKIAGLMHCVAAHHGKIEWDALVEPETVEAFLLSKMDLLDSRMDIFDRHLDKMQPGERDESTRRYLGNIVYKPKEEAPAASAEQA